MTGTKRTVLYIGAMLSIAFGFLTPKVHNYSHDGRQLYVGAHLLLLGKNPYDHQQLVRGYAEFAHEAHGVDQSPAPQIHLPATFVALAPLTLLPWPVFCWMQILLNAFCIPVVAYICLRRCFVQPPIPILCLSAFCIAILPGTWQNFALGQIALPISVLTFGTIELLKTQNSRLGVPAVLLALVKFTLCLPLLAYSFFIGSRAARLILAAGLAIFIFINLFGVLLIGPRQFLSSYEQNNSATFSAGTQNDIHGEGRRARVDLECLLSSLPNPLEVSATKIVIGGILFTGFMYRRPKVEITIADLSALSLFALILFYHRTYDTVLLSPCIILVLMFLLDRRLAGFRALFAGLLVITLAAIGSDNHNVVDVLLRHVNTRQPTYFKALCLLLDALVLVFGILLPSREDCDRQTTNLKPTAAPS